MKIFSSLLALTALTLGLLSCGKDDDNPTPSADQKTTDITASAWIHENSGIDINKDGAIDVPLALFGVQQCQLDNVLTFKKDGTATADEGATKCTSTDPQTTNFNWNFADNQSTLKISNNPFAVLNGNFKIKTLTSTNFTLTRDTTAMGQSGTIIVNLKH